MQEYENTTDKAIKLTCILINPVVYKIAEYHTIILWLKPPVYLTSSLILVM